MTCKTVITARKSENAKLGKMAATYVSQATCPRSCPMLGHGCYAESGYVGMLTHKLASRPAGEPARHNLAVQAAKDEAAAIGSLPGDRPLRLHVVGDIEDAQSHEILARAAREYTAVSDQPVYTYTHNWRNLDSAQRGINMAASCDSLPEAFQALSQGWRVATYIVPKHASDKAWRGTYTAPFTGQERPVTVVPCPAQTRGKTCEQCRLCVDGKVRNMVIAFEAHGTGARKVRERLAAQ